MMTVVAPLVPAEAPVRAQIAECCQLVGMVEGGAVYRMKPAGLYFPI